MSDLLSLTPAEFCIATNACSGGREYALTQPTMADVWDNCPRADWLMWIADKINRKLDDRTLRLLAVWCARNTPIADGRKTGDLLTDSRSIAALDVSERYAVGESSMSELAAAEAAAWDAAGAATYAAEAAAWAAAWAAAYAAEAAAWDVEAAVRAAAYAARAAARAAAWDAAYASQAEQLRTMIPNPFRKEAQP